MITLAATWTLILGALLRILAGGNPIEVEVPIGASRDIDVAELVARLSDASGLAVARPSGELRLPIVGLAGGLTRSMLTDSLGPDASLSIRPRALVVTLDARVRQAECLPRWERRVKDLAARAEDEVRRRSNYGMHALKSYRPNDPARPTVLLVHGLNSTSRVFKHLIGTLEGAGFGLVVYDFPYNRRLDDSCARFRDDWAAFRRQAGESLPWAIVAHSMGSLLARSYVEHERGYAGDVSTLILIAPPNAGSALSRVHTAMEFLKGTRAVGGGETAEAFLHLGDGLGEAAGDMTPGSAFLRALNRRPRRDGVGYHILAGDIGFLNAAARRRIETQVALLGGVRGVLGGMARAASADLTEGLDELTDGSGDGLVTVERTRLGGVSDHVTIHANHLELIRAPLLYPDPGPIACLPYVLRWLEARTPRVDSPPAPR